MSESPSKVPANSDRAPSLAEDLAETLSDKQRKLNWSQSENVFDNQRIAKSKQLSKAKSWTSKDRRRSQDKCVSVELDLARSLTRLDNTEPSSSSSQQDIANNLLRARDSLENLAKNAPEPSVVVQAKCKNGPDSPKSSPQLGEKWKPSTSKVSYWQSKKNRKDLKKKGKMKNEASPKSEGSSMPVEGKKLSIMKGDHQSNETNNNGQNDDDDSSLMEDDGLDKYRYVPKNSKSVVFTNEVLVVYFNNEGVVEEEKEPLKKEMEQQTRNKEMRRVHLNKTEEKYNLCLF